LNKQKATREKGKAKKIEDRKEKKDRNGKRKRRETKSKE
jgi:hypothetical protein